MERSPIIYTTIFDALVIDVVMGICRLTDPSEMGKGFEQLSIDRVVDAFVAVVPLFQTLDDIRNRVHNSANALRPFRDKYFAHASLAESLDSTTQIEWPANVMRDGVEQLHALVHALSHHYGENWDIDATPIVDEGQALRRVLTVGNKIVRSAEDQNSPNFSVSTPNRNVLF